MIRYNRHTHIEYIYTCGKNAASGVPPLVLLLLVAGDMLLPSLVVSRTHRLGKDSLYLGQPPAICCVLRVFFVLPIDNQRKCCVLIFRPMHTAIVGLVCGGIVRREL